MQQRIKLLGICASPRKGNSYYLLQKALEDTPKAKFQIDSRIYHMQGKKIAPCISCFKCGKNNGVCILKDDFEELRQLWIESDVIIYSTPVYHLSVPAQLKCFIDRLGNSFYGYYKVPSVRHMKAIGVLCQGMHLFGGQELASSYLIQHAVLQNSIPVAGDGWQSYIGAAGWTDNKGDRDALSNLYVGNNYDAQITIDAAKSVVKRATEIAYMLKLGAKASEEILKDDERYRPYLSRLEK